MLRRTDCIHDACYPVLVCLQEYAGSNLYADRVVNLKAETQQSIRTVAETIRLG